MSIASKIKQWSKVSREIEKDIADLPKIPPAEMALIELSNAMRNARRLGIDKKIINDTLINSFDYRDLSEFVSDADAFLRGRTY